MPERLPPNLEDAYRTELAGLEARLPLAGDDKRAALEERIGSLRGLLGEANGVLKRRGRPPREYRPGDDGGSETREV